MGFFDDLLKRLRGERDPEGAERPTPRDLAGPGFVGNRRPARRRPTQDAQHEQDPRREAEAPGDGAE